MTMTTISYVTLDVFTTTRYAGNPLAVVQIPPQGLTQTQKQQIAREFNYSETTFVHPRRVAAADAAEWTVDIFTTEQELPFAGHPTIGTACHLLRALVPSAEPRPATVKGTFRLKAGRVDLEYDVRSGRARAQIPHDFHVHGVTMDGAELVRLQPSIGRVPAESAVVSIVKGMTFVLVELDCLDSLAFVNTTSYPIALRLDWDEGHDSFIACYFYCRLATVDGVIRLRTRMIESSVGEDPATGSAACALACYLSLQRRMRDATARYEIVQGEEMGRRSEIGVAVRLGTNGAIESVALSGCAVQVMSGQIAAVRTLEA